ncbi:MAG: EamA family transporter, partial [Burkholderiales bacterium]
MKLPLAFTALIAGLQPILTGVVASVILGERLRPIHWLGMLLGSIGVLMAVSPTLARGEVGMPALSCAALALIGITAGTVYQKRFCSGMDLRTGGVIQFSATGLVLFGCAAAF